MGIDVQGLDCLRFASKFGPFGESVTLGRQLVFTGPSALRTRLGEKSIGLGAEQLLLTYFGASDVQSVDYSDYEQATLLHDLNRPLPKGFRRFDIVIDFGTLEHVFDVRQGLENTRQMCREGGQILHVSPTNNFCGHGF